MCIEILRCCLFQVSHSQGRSRSSPSSTNKLLLVDSRRAGIVPGSLRKGFYPLVDLLFNGPDPVHHSHVISRTTNLCPLCVSRMPDDEKAIEDTSLILLPPLPPYLLPQGWLPIYRGKIHCGTFLLGAGGDRVNML